ncbi:Uncharacterised protein [uncultured archaeon]|nr:Uncharacterised protein [uncultured archaeon]
MNRPLLLICVLVMLVATACAEELMFFADDHYKAAGEPELKASAVNPVLEPGANSTLRITLENVGLIQELIPNNAGDATEISAEAKDELHSVDAVNITAKLSGNGPVVVTSGPYSLGSLPTGGVAQLDFNVTTGKGADGWYSLLLETEYEHQMDVKVSNGSSSSLYRPSNSSQKISILVQGPDRSLKVEGVVSDLYPGANGTILAVIKNNGLYVARNCTAKLMAVQPFRSSSERYSLGDLQPGHAAVARLTATVDGKAAIREYRLACEIVHDNQTVMVSLPVLLKKSPESFPSSLVIVIPFLALVGGIALLMREKQKRSGRTFGRRKRWL